MLRSQLDAIATLLDEGAANSALRMLRNAWDPELPREDRVPLYCMWIRGLCETGELAHALKLATRATDEFPDEVDVWIALGNVQDLRGDLERSKQAFSQAVQLAPEGALQQYNLGSVLDRLGEDEDAETCYINALNSDEQERPLLETVLALGALLRRKERTHEAAKIYESYLSEDPLNLDILLEQGICLSELEAFEEAIERFKAILAMDEEHAGALYNLAITYYRVGRVGEALSIMKDALKSDPSNPLTLAVLGAWTLDQPGDHVEEALQLMHSAIESLHHAHSQGQLPAGYAGMVMEELFMALWQHEQHEQAREIATTAIRYDFITQAMLAALNHVDHEPATKAELWVVALEGESEKPPEHWPVDSKSFQQKLWVLAADRESAKSLALAFVQAVEPASVDVRIVDSQCTSEDLRLPCDIEGSEYKTHGVVRIAEPREYITCEDDDEDDGSPH